MKLGSIVGWLWRYPLLVVLFLVTYVGGGLAVQGVLPDIKPEPGPLPETLGILVVAISCVLIIVLMITSSRWRGLKLIAATSLAYYGAVTLVMQIETWYFLTEITVGPELLPRLFVTGLPVALVFIPLAVLIVGKRRLGPEPPQPNRALVMPAGQWAWKLALIAVIYFALYFGAGYWIAWQNPELRAFYGQPGDAKPFLAHLLYTVTHDPLLFPFQVLRSLAWTACALPVIRASRLKPWQTALIVGLLFGVPQNIGHILPNPILPLNSVRISHLVETLSSTCLFGVIVTWLLHRKHRSFMDLFARERVAVTGPTGRPK